MKTYDPLYQSKCCNAKVYSAPEGGNEGSTRWYECDKCGKPCAFDRFLTENDIGKWVTYKPELENERGRIKNYNNEKRIAWIVYKANGNLDMDHWKDYTAQATKYDDFLLD